MPGIMVSDMKNKFYTNLNILKETLYGEIIRKGYFLRNPESVRALYIAAGVIIMIVAGSAAGFLSPYSMGKNIIAGILTGIPVLAFSRVMPAKTKAGAAVYIDILGFQEFMNRAEKTGLREWAIKNSSQNSFLMLLPLMLPITGQRLLREYIRSLLNGMFLREDLPHSVLTDFPVQ